MNDHDFHYRVRQHLNSSAHALPPTVTARLRQSRQTALNRQKVAVRGLSFAGIGQALSEHIMPRGRTAVSVLLVVVAVLGVGYLGELQRTADLEEVDSALLADDLPIDAYLDSGFDAWVQNDSPD